MRIYRPDPDVLDGSYMLPATEPIGAAETREITREAYTYGFPLVETYKTLHKQAINNACPSFGLIVHHDDADREYAYGPADGLLNTHFGTFPQSLMDEAKTRGWVVISMKSDWKELFSS